MGAQANCCKQPENVIEENKLTTLGATDIHDEKKETISPQDTNVYKSENVIYANPIYQAKDSSEKYTVNSKVYNQYFDSNNQNQQSTAENLRSHASQDQKADQQQEQQQLDQQQDDK